MNTQEIRDRAQAIEKRTEVGETVGLSEELNSMSLADRLAVAKEMQQLNEEHRKLDDSLPMIEISVSNGSDGSEQLQAIHKQEKRGWYNPRRWFGNSYDDATTLYYRPYQKESSDATGAGSVTGPEQHLNMLLQLLLLNNVPQDGGRLRLLQKASDLHK